MSEEATLDLGFTGTRQGMTPEQEENIRKFMWKALQKRPRLRVHHGDCIGSDAGMHDLARSLGDACEIHVHPPSSSAMRAWCDGDVTYDTRPYLDRNMDIIEACAVILATPQGMKEEQRSGTWSTIRRAVKLGRRVLIFYPDGTIGQGADIA